MNKTILILLFAFTSAVGLAQNTRATHFNLEKKVAIQGYDPVAYFENNMAVKGEPTISTNFDGAIYYFSTEANKSLFLNNPEQYEPQFGGYCAYGMSNGYKAPIKPEAFTIVNNKLYLNYNLEVRAMWQKEKADRIQKAQVNWEKLIKK